ncbi:MAG TPA: hypothetical protein VNN10_01145 [Dehalococcoidia bacterium]|nr:hypothetical protein [Dehalococcoidia bacterium]
MSGWLLRLSVLLGAAALVALYLLSSPAATTADPESGVTRATNAVEPPASAPAPAPWTGPRAARTADLRLGPSDDYVVLGVLPRGAKLEVVGASEDGLWIAVAVAPGSSLYGWLKGADVTGAPDAASLPIKPVRLLPE